MLIYTSKDKNRREISDRLWAQCTFEGGKDKCRQKWLSPYHHCDCEIIWNINAIHVKFPVLISPHGSNQRLCRQGKSCCLTFQHQHHSRHVWSMSCWILHTQHPYVYASQSFVSRSRITNARINKFHCSAFIPKMPRLQPYPHHKTLAFTTCISLVYWK